MGVDAEAPQPRRRVEHPPPRLLGPVPGVLVRGGVGAGADPRIQPLADGVHLGRGGGEGVQRVLVVLPGADDLLLVRGRRGGRCLAPIGGVRVGPGVGVGVGVGGDGRVGVRVDGGVGRRTAGRLGVRARLLLPSVRGPWPDWGVPEPECCPDEGECGVVAGVCPLL
ncbi:hypothetical protein SAZ11_00605 [Streptomyces sp. FXJ1.4098]|nr:hypothetical protein [Streptomyces sp. FXJ1.4098]